MRGIEIYVIVVLAVGIIIGILCLIYAFRLYRRKRLIDDLPTSKTHGVFIGVSELSGTAEVEQPLTSFLAEVECVYFSYKVEEHWSRTVTESYTDSEGRHQTRTRTESGWQVVSRVEKRPPFYLRDDTGVIRINPSGAEIHAKQVFNTNCSRNNPLYYEKGPAHSVSDSTHYRRFIEYAIPLKAKLYVIGHAQERKDAVAAEIVKSKKSPIFLISTHDERHHSRGLKEKFWFWSACGFASSVGTAAICYATGELALSLVMMLAPVIAFYLVAFFVAWVWTIYNSLARLRLRVKQASSQIEVQLKRRYDLIPRIMETVTAYRDYESGLLKTVTEIRSQVELAQEDENLREIKGLLPTLLAVAEKYPTLKADDQFLNMQKCLTETEQRLTLARDYYNQITTFYNTRLEIVPDRFLAKIFGFKPISLLSSSGLERAVVEVDLSS